MPTRIPKVTRDMRPMKYRDRKPIVDHVRCPIPPHVYYAHYDGPQGELVANPKPDLVFRKLPLLRPLNEYHNKQARIVTPRHYYIPPYDVDRYRRELQADVVVYVRAAKYGRHLHSHDGHPVYQAWVQQTCDRDEPVLVGLVDPKQRIASIKPNDSRMKFGK